jgi:hypothetical protein
VNSDEWKALVYGSFEPPIKPWCWEKVLDCSGNGRPTCKATECMFGVEPCPMGNHFKPVGAKCGFVHQGRKCVEEE